MNDLVFSIDPSSTCSGWALLGPGEEYVASGRLLPPTVTIEPKACAPYYRIDAMCMALRKLLDQHRPRHVVIEWTSGKRAGRLGMNVSGLAIYGAAVGALWREAVHWTDYWLKQGLAGYVVGIIENDWTRGQPKARRIPIAAGLFPQYDPEQDSGGDEADALMLNVWYQREQKLRELSERANQ